MMIEMAASTARLTDLNPKPPHPVKAAVRKYLWRCSGGTKHFSTMAFSISRLSWLIRVMHVQLWQPHGRRQAAQDLPQPP